MLHRPRPSSRRAVPSALAARSPRMSLRRRLVPFAHVFYQRYLVARIRLPVASPTASLGFGYALPLLVRLRRPRALRAVRRYAFYDALSKTQSPRRQMPALFALPFPR
ncbi:hypothetical protein ES705_41556 [subsurface metagenome]